MEKLLEEHGIKPTANRILIARALREAGRPLSMTELESVLESIDKSNIFRTLDLFRKSHLVHALEDSADGTRYELCHSNPGETDEDLHVHFHCEKCHRTYCLEDIPIPHIDLPEGYNPQSASFTISGICPSCR